MLKYTATFITLLFTSAFGKDHFMNDDQELFQIKAGVCQAVADDGYLYDISEFDKQGRENGEPANVEDKFYYKTCQPEFDFSDVAGLQQGFCQAKAAAFLKEGNDCKYSFSQPEFASTGEGYFALKYSSDQECEEQPGQPASYSLIAYCEDDISEEDAQALLPEDTQCSYSKLMKNCPKKINLAGPFQTAKKFFGVILIINGLALCFAGSIYLFAALAGLVFLGVAGIVLGGASNFNLVNKDSKSYIIALVVIIGLGLGGIAGYFAYTLGQDYAMTFLTGIIGFIIGIIGCTIGQVKQSFVKAGVAIVLALIGVYLGKTFNKYAKSIGTACVGAFLFAVGVAEYDQKSPNFFEADEFLNDDGTKIDTAALKDKRTIAYLVGIVVFSAAGSFVQLKYVAPDDEDADDMFNKDNA